MTRWDELLQGDFTNVLAWASSEPWALAMAKCQQDAVWHSEGDVWTHSCMVCSQLLELEEWPRLTQRERAILLFVALLHDSGKPVTSQVDPDTGRISSPKHALKGEHIARNVLRGLGCDLQTREEIARLVRFHGRPTFLLEKQDPQQEVISLSWSVNNKLLYLFAVADTRGRDTDEMTRPEENLYFWKIVAEENDCFERPYPFANAHARFLFYRKSLSDLHYVPHEAHCCTVTMMSGLPGSGKDTWLSQHRPDLPVVSLDDIREEMDVEATADQGNVVQLARERCRELLRSKASFAFCATNIFRQTRSRWLDLFANYDARIEEVYIEPPMAAILRQNKQRERTVPETVIRDLATKCEPPTWTEAHDLVLVG